jgi:hypothetical protein
MAHPGVNVVIRLEFLRCYGDQLFDIVDNLADVVGDASDRVGGMGSLLEGNDLKIFFESLRLGGGAHPRRVSADDYETFLCHEGTPPAAFF